MFTLEDLIKRGWTLKGVNLYIGTPDKKVTKEGKETLFFFCKRVISAEQFLDERNCRKDLI